MPGVLCTKLRSCRSKTYLVLEMVVKIGVIVVLVVSLNVNYDQDLPHHNPVEE
jgi:hypothetical protein